MTKELNATLNKLPLRIIGNISMEVVEHLGKYYWTIAENNYPWIIYGHESAFEEISKNLYDELIKHDD